MTGRALVTGGTGAPVRRRRAGWYALALVVLAPFLVETVATSNTPAARFPLVLPLFAVVYGCPALLVREAWLRGRLTAPRLLLAGLGYTAFNEGVVAATWFKLAPGTGRVLAFTAAQAGHAAGVNWAVATGLLIFHTAYSLMLPITVVQALAVTGRTGADRRPWANRAGLILCALLIAVVLLGALSPKATARTCAGPALETCSRGRPIVAGVVLLVGVVLAVLPAPRRAARGRRDRPPMPGGVQVALGAAFGLAFTVAFFVLPLLGLPVAAITLDALLLAVVAVVAARWSRPGTRDIRGDVLVGLGAVLPGMAASFAAWRVGQPLAALLGALLFGYLLWRLRGKGRERMPEAGSPP